MQTEHNTDNKSKVIIGQYYQAPLKNHVTCEGEFWQSVYLGEYQREVQFSRHMQLYIAVLIILFVTLAIIL
jgi:hypothetical protein